MHPHSRVPRIDIITEDGPRITHGLQDDFLMGHRRHPHFFAGARGRLGLYCGLAPFFGRVDQVANGGLPVWLVVFGLQQFLDVFRCRAERLQRLAVRQ